MHMTPTDPALIARVESRAAYHEAEATRFVQIAGDESAYAHDQSEIAADLRALLARIRELEAERDDLEDRMRPKMFGAFLDYEKRVGYVLNEQAQHAFGSGWCAALRSLASAPAGGGG